MSESTNNVMGSSEKPLWQKNQHIHVGKYVTHKETGERGRVYYVFSIMSDFEGDLVVMVGEEKKIWNVEELKVKKGQDEQ